MTDRGPKDIIYARLKAIFKTIESCVVRVVYNKELFNMCLQYKSIVEQLLKFHNSMLVNQQIVIPISH